MVTTQLTPVTINTSGSIYGFVNLNAGAEGTGQAKKDTEKVR